jgi:hypothetical protein
VVVAYVAMAALVASWWWPAMLTVVAAGLAVLWLLDRPYYEFFRAQRGLTFTLAWFPFHVLHHLCNGVSFAMGTMLWWARRSGMNPPWSLPVTPWTRAERETRESLASVQS